MPPGGVRNRVTIGNRLGLHARAAAKFVQLAGVELPEENVVVSQILMGGQIEPGREYLVWFAPEKNESINMKLAIRLSEELAKRFEDQY